MITEEEPLPELSNKFSGTLESYPVYLLLSARASREGGGLFF
jgi:hypothetical protein